MNQTSKAPMLPENFAFYSYQIAGHHYSKQKGEEFGVLYCQKTRHVLKPLQKYPRGETEKKFYERVWAIEKPAENQSSSERFDVFDKLRSFIPRYYGLRSLCTNGRTANFLELENLTAAYRKPCVMDIKIGARTWDPWATEDKISYEKSKYPHAAQLGFRLLGTMVYKENTDSFEHKDKHWGKALDENNVLPALRGFFPHDPQTAKILATCLLRKLRRISTFFSQQRRLNFYSSSLLFSYEGGLQRLYTNSNGFLHSKNIDGPLPSPVDQLVDVRMIDFTHVFERDKPFGKVPSYQDGTGVTLHSDGDLDENYLHGLNNLIKYFTMLLDSLVV